MEKPVTPASPAGLFLPPWEESHGPPGPSQSRGWPRRETSQNPSACASPPAQSGAAKATLNLTHVCGPGKCGGSDSHLCRLTQRQPAGRQGLASSRAPLCASLPSNAPTSMPDGPGMPDPSSCQQTQCGGSARWLLPAPVLASIPEATGSSTRGRACQARWDGPCLLHPSWSPPAAAIWDPQVWVVAVLVVTILTTRMRRDGEPVAPRLCSSLQREIKLCLSVIAVEA